MTWKAGHIDATVPDSVPVPTFEIVNVRSLSPQAPNVTVPKLSTRVERRQMGPVCCPAPKHETGPHPAPERAMVPGCEPVVVGENRTVTAAC